MPMFRRARYAALLALSFPFSALATLSIFEHGNGIRSMGMGGTVYATGEETTTLAANPALALSLGRRYDVGADLFMPEARASYTGNQAGSSEEFYKTSGRTYYWIPQGGVNLPLSDRLALGFTLISAGLGPDYDRSPYQRFGAERRASMFLMSSSLVSALAYEIAPGHAVGISLNLGYQTLAVKGLQFGQGISVNPDRVTNQGTDGAMTAGFGLGWKGDLTPWLSAAASYRSRNWTEKHKDYAGLLPEGGRLDVPAVWGVGVALKPIRNWTFAFDFQRFEHEAEKAFGNRLSQLEQGHLLGSADGPGFGLKDQDAYKFGVAWQRTPRLTLRAGYITASQAVRSSETLFAFLGPVVMTEHYTAGFTYDLDGWEWSGFYAHVPRQQIRGRNSLPAALGGGEADLTNEVETIGLSLGRRFGG